ncbi:MAG: CdaR family protein [Verrucomicrobiota bacterium]
MPADLNGFTQILFLNIRIKLVALLLAAITWYAIHKAINQEINIDDIQVDILLEEGWTVQEQSADTVDIRFRGSQDDIRYLHSDIVKVIVDGRQAEPGGPQTVIFQARHVKAPGGARPLSFRPAKIVFAVDKEDRKLVPVKEDLTGEPPDGFEVTDVTIQPDTVQIFGPLLRLNEIADLKTAPIDLNGRESSFKTRASVVSQDSSWNAQLDPEWVNVEVTIRERSSNINLDQVIVRALTDPAQPAGVTIEPPVVKVVLKGRAKVLNSLELELIRAYVDCAGLESGATSKVPVQVHAPAPIEVEEIVPPAVEVRVGKRADGL